MPRETMLSPYWYVCLINSYAFTCICVHVLHIQAHVCPHHSRASACISLHLRLRASQVDATAYRASVAPLLSTSGIDMLPGDVDGLDGPGRQELAEKINKKRAISAGSVADAAAAAGVPEDCASNKGAQLGWLMSNWPAAVPAPDGPADALAAAAAAAAV